MNIIGVKWKWHKENFSRKLMTVYHTNVEKMPHIIHNA